MPLSTANIRARREIQRRMLTLEETGSFFGAIRQSGVHELDLHMSEADRLLLREYHLSQ